LDLILKREFLMPQPHCAARFGLLLALALSTILAQAAHAVPVVWSGPTITFTKQSIDPTNAANQDRLTSNVWLTRGGQSQGGMFNIAQESFYDGGSHTSPVDTLWATDLVPGNVDKTIAASNWQNLTFTTWADAYEGPTSLLLGNITTHNAVVKLVTDDIYLNLIFTGFSSSGFFEYQRSTGAVTPSPTGDYNHNHVVDAADYTLWRKTLNGTVSPNGSGADGDSSGTIGAGDYTYWRLRFGNAAPGAGSLAGELVPEPTTIALQLGWMFALTWRVRKTTTVRRTRKI
jgi:hypothetical protein